LFAKSATKSSTHLPVGYITKLHCPLNYKPFKSCTQANLDEVQQTGRRAAGNPLTQAFPTTKSEVAQMS